MIYLNKKIIKYSPYTPKEIDIYKKETSNSYNNTSNSTNFALSMIRKKFFLDNSFNKSLNSKINHFNKVIQSKDIADIISTIKVILNQN